jgi:PEP-CTERM motif
LFQAAERQVNPSTTGSHCNAEEVKIAKAGNFSRRSRPSLEKTMTLKPSLLAVALAAAAAVPAHADTLVVNLAGWSTFGEFGAPDNTSAYFTLPAGSSVTGFSYTNLTFTSFGASFQSELVLSLNNFTGAPTTIDDYLDWSPSVTNATGTFGPASGTWNGATGQPGPFGSGAAFTVGGGTDNLWVTVYEAFGDDELPDATISAGTLTISFTPPIPEPATYGLMALGLLGVAGAARRRRPQP